MSGRHPDLVSILEAAYTVDATNEAWLKGLMEAMRPNAEDGLGMAAYLYDTSKRPFHVWHLTHDSPVDEVGLSMLLDGSNDDYVRRSWQTPSASTASETPGYEDHPGVHQVFHPVGIRDIMVVNALDPIGVGCWLGAPLREVRKLDDLERERWGRVAAHVRSALRLRLRLAARAVEADVSAANEVTEPAPAHAAVEAVLTPEGKVEHLESAAERSREALREAVLQIERARGELRSESDRALPSWKALVQARWTLVDDFQSDGRRYVLARANEYASTGLLALTPRERQVAACVAQGHTNKEVAYELGLSHSTVRVLVARACAKLNARTRGELIENYRRGSLG
jgi:DNA-binding CsgD family transcriptional regulator